MSGSSVPGGGLPINSVVVRTTIIRILTVRSITQHNRLSICRYKRGLATRIHWYIWWILDPSTVLHVKHQDASRFQHYISGCCETKHLKNVQRRYCAPKVYLVCDLSHPSFTFLLSSLLITVLINKTVCFFCEREVRQLKLRAQAHKDTPKNLSTRVKEPCHHVFPRTSQLWQWRRIIDEDHLQTPTWSKICHVKLSTTSILFRLWRMTSAAQPILKKAWLSSKTSSIVAVVVKLSGSG